MSLKLTKRLQAVADFVRKGHKTADVGTDHGYLPAFLVLTNVTNSAIAADIGIGPLDNARKTVEKFGLEDKIDIVLSDGLKNIPDDTDEIIIAGMGGTLIADILRNDNRIQNENIHLILQPMTHSQDVRKFLCENGFYIDNEKTVEDSGKVYIVISAFYNGNNETKDEYYYFFGDKIMPASETDKSYIHRQYSYVKSKCHGFELSNNTEAEKYRKILFDAERDGKNI